MTAIDSRPAIGTACPKCTAALVSERGARPWCERCGWGIDVYEPPVGAGFLERRIGRSTFALAYRLSLRQFAALARGRTPYGDQLVAGGGPVVAAIPRAGLTGTRVATLAFAGVFYLLIVGLAAGGVWLTVTDFPSLLVVPGLLVFLISLYLLPRFGRLAKHDAVLDRSSAPELYALVDRVAAGVGSRPPHLIVVDPWFNASARSVGLRRRRVLTLGLGLWGSLDPQQRIALLGHELGHFSNGDVRRGFLVQPCLTSLGRLADLFGGRSRPPAGRNIVAIVQPLVDLVMRLLSSLFYLGHLGVLALGLRQGQRAEYLADQRAAALAGTRATAELLDLLGGSIDSVVASRARAQQLQDSWQAAAAESLRTTAASRSRLRQLSLRTEPSLWSTHPPSGLRAWLVESAAWREPGLTLSAAESERIDASLARHYRDARLALAHSTI